MTSKNITTKVLLATFFSIYLSIVGYTILLPIIFVMNPEETKMFWIRMMAVAVLIGPVATYIVYVFYKPIQKVIKIMESGGNPGPEMLEKTHKAFKSIEGFLFIVGIVSYNLCAAINMIIEILRLGSVDGLFWIFRYILASGFGLMNGMLTARLVNLTWIDAKYRLGLTDLPRNARRSVTWKKLGIPFTVLIVSILIFLCSAVLYYALQSDNGVVQFSFSESLAHFIPFTIILCIEALIILFLLLLENQSHINHIQNQLDALSSGSMDLTSRVHIISYDDMGLMAHKINMILDNLRNSFTSIETHAVSLAEIGRKLSENMAETASSIRHISSTIHGVRSETENQSVSVNETNASVEQISKTIEKLNIKIENQAMHVSESSFEIEQMLKSIGSVTDTLVHNRDNIQTLSDSSEESRKNLESVVQSIQKVSSESQSLLQISDVIQDIASRTNLLSMNAAIEAAHAGLSGRGFAVVANEIRKLAETTDEEAKKVSTILNSIKGGLDSISNSTSIVMQTFEDMEGEMDTVVKQEHSIRNSMEEQNAKSKHVYEILNQLREITEEVKNSSIEMLSGSSQVKTEGGNLIGISQKINNNMNDISKETENISSVVSVVDEMSIKNRDNITALTDELKKFKT